MVVRKAVAEDAPALAVLETVCLKSDPWSEAALTSCILDDDCPTLVACDGGRLCGYVTGRCLPPEAELYRICTHPDVRRQGVAEALLTAFHDALRACRCEVCYLEVRDGNTPARGLYGKAGYEQCGTRKNYYRAPTEDAVIYVIKFED